MGFFHDRTLKACRDGDINAARRRLRREPNVNARGSGEDGHTPLTIASTSNQIEMAKFLLDEAGADVNATSETNNTALHYARSGEMASILLSKGANVNARDAAETPLHVSCRFLREGVIQVLLKAGATVNITDKFSRLPMRSVMAEVAESIPELLETGARILQDLVRHGAQWRQNCEEWMDFTYILQGDRRLWEQVRPALRFAVLLWIEDRRLGLPLTPIPQEEMLKGLEATATYVKEFKASKHIVCRRTICIVGPSTAGKTSLIKSLIQKQVCLEHIDDRTIGIDYFVLEFDEPRKTSAAVRRTHEVKFSDFAGQDVYQGMHSLFFTRRTLFLICIDLNAYSITLLKCEMLTPDDAKLQHMMNEYVDRTVLSWIRIIFGRQPDAEFVFVYTKEDTISSGPGVDKKEVVAHAKMMLERVMVITEDMRQQNKSYRDQQRHTKQLVKQQTERDRDEQTAEKEQVAKPITHLWDVRLDKCHKPKVDVVMTNASSAHSVESVRGKIERLIIESGKSYETPEKYAAVLKALIKKRMTAREYPIDVMVLVEELQQEVPGLGDVTATKSILRTLRDCVDILWYEDMEDTKLQTTVMLDPQLLIEFLRQMINHKHVSGVICHAILSGLSYWKELNGDQEDMLAMKRLLQSFRLVHPASGEMAFDSDLIVPAYWKTNPAALWVFGGEDLRLNPCGMEIETVARRVHWEFRFTHFIPETLFDHLIVASYSPGRPLQVGPDWILYRDGELAACRIVVSRHWKTHERSLLLEAVLSSDAMATKNHENDLWIVFQRLCDALASVVKEHPGLSVTSFAHTDIEGNQPSLTSILHAINKGTMTDETWMPPKSIASKCVRRLTGKRVANELLQDGIITKRILTVL